LQFCRLRLELRDRRARRSISAMPDPMARGHIEDGKITITGICPACAAEEPRQAAVDMLIIAHATTRAAVR